jgi:hypothetical protein
LGVTVKLDDETDVQFVSSPRSLAEAVCNVPAGDKRDESGKWAHAAHVYLSRTHFSFAICSRDLTHEELRSAEDKLEEQLGTQRLFEWPLRAEPAKA